MNCQQVQKLIHAYHDGELDVANMLQADEHLADCPGCFSTLRQLSSLRVALQDERLRTFAPAGLRDSIRAAIAHSAAAEQEAPPSRPWFHYSGWAAAAAAIAVSAILFAGQRGRDEDRLVADLTSSHIRSLLAAHLTDVASTDQHTVKPWFDGKLDFAPPVRDLRESGFPLLGGRLEVIDGHPAAALVYGRQKHYLNLFIWPAKSAEPHTLQVTQRNGYNVAQWSDGKMNLNVVSDLNETDLRVFVADWSGR